MKQITNKTILKQEEGEENCKEYGCGNIECTFECLKPKKIFKTYQPVEVDGVIYWVDNRLPNFGERYIDYIYKNVRTWDIIVKKEALPYCDIIVAQSQSKLEEIPIVDFNDFVNENGELPYTQKDIEKAFELGYQCRVSNGYKVHGTYQEDYKKAVEQINSISVIEVDEQFNILSYE